MREKEIEKKLTQMVKRPVASAPSSSRPVLTVCRTAWCCCRMGGYALWKSKLRGKTETVAAFPPQALRRLGFPVYVLDDAEQIGGILDEIRTP